jgi:hypothetical protein
MPIQRAIASTKIGMVMSPQMAENIQVCPKDFEWIAAVSFLKLHPGQEARYLYWPKGLIPMIVSLFVLFFASSDSDNRG